MEIITSLKNPTVKAVCDLKQKKHRLEQKCFIAEGVRIVEEAVRYARVASIFVTDSAAGEERVQAALTLAAEKGIALYSVTDAVMKKMSDTETPQGILAVCRQADAGLDSIAAASAPLLVLDRIADPGNLGTLIRTAEAAGMGGIVLLEGCADAFAPKTVRATMGSLLRMKLITDVNEGNFVKWAKANGYEIAVTCLDGAQSLYNADLSGRTAIVIGSEAYGASDTLKRAAARRIFIPMCGCAESLNAAVAGGIVMFECRRRSCKG